MSRDVFGDTDEGGQTCVMCCNVRLPSGDKVLLAKKSCDCQAVNTTGGDQLKMNL
jgi:hypothetical protein